MSQEHLILLLREALDTIEMLYHPKDRNRRANRERWIRAAKSAIAEATK